MRIFKDTKRRVKQQMMEKVGLAQSTEDGDFQAEYAEWKGTVDSARHLQGTMRAHGAATKKQCQTAAALSVQLAAFHRGTTSADGAMALGHVHAELERVQLAAIERLYEEEVIAAADLILWQVPEVEERVKQRRKLLLDRNSHRRKYEAASAALEENQQNQSGNGGILRRAKGESELSAEVATRKVKLEHAEAAVEEATEWCLAQFRELLDRRETGNVLGGPMAAFLACQRKLMSAGSHKLDKIRHLLPLSNKFDETLGIYEQEFARAQAASGNDLFDGFDTGALLNNSTEVLGGFGAPLPEVCPPVIREAIEFLETNGGLETEGLFRIAGSAETVHEIRERYNAGETGVFEQMNCDPHDVAGVIKRYLQDLPESLIPTTYYQSMVEAGSTDDGGDAIAEVMAEIPESHIQCLSPLLQFLYRVARRSDINRMTFANLATCLAPTIIRAPQDESPVKIMNEMQPVIFGFKTLIEQAKRYDLGPSAPLPARAPLPPMAPTQSFASALPPAGPIGHRHMSRRLGGSGKGIGSMIGSARSRMSMRRDSSSTALTAGMW